MKNILFFLFFLLLIQTSFAQCNNSITHAQGAQNINGTLVTVSSNGSSEIATDCSHNYWIGKNLGTMVPTGASGSFTYNFSPAITGFTLSIGGIDNFDVHFEEVILYINGQHFNITQAGDGINCLGQHLALINENGNIGSPFMVGSSGWNNFEILGSEIETLTILNSVTSGVPNGSLYHINFCNNSLINPEFDGNLVNIYPNPMTDYLQINLPKAYEKGEGVIYNNLGQVVKTEILLSGNSFISRDGLPTGIYCLTILGDNQTLYSKRLIIK